ncbi:MAG: hypothetical protein M1816_006721 [Peltula sp. TS41687]|nr:MAG: hypothetical protein M1816_006721 [Peltula sp. TS41687]
MPIKLPKGFPRRKSSGNVLDETEPTVTPSFRVLERPSQQSKSFDGGSKLGTGVGGPSVHPPSPAERVRRTSFDQSRTNSNRGSGGSNTNSTSTGGFHDNASSSRLSTSSTVPSSIGTPAPDDPYITMQHKPLPTVPPQPLPESQPASSVKTGGRTFSFGSKAPKFSIFGGSRQSKDSAVVRGDSSPSAGPFRSRGMTESSYASTATPPKLETDLGPSDLGGFAGIFDNIGRRGSEPWEESEPTIGSGAADAAGWAGAADDRIPLPSNRTQDVYSDGRVDVTRPAPIHIDRSREVEPSAFSWGSHRSDDRLMNSPSPPLPTTPSFGDPAPPVPQHRTGPASPETVIRKNTTPEDNLSTPRAKQARPSSGITGGLKRSSAIMDRRSTMPLLDDEDARLVQNSVNVTRSMYRRSGDSTKAPRTPVQTSKDRDSFRNDRQNQSVTPTRTSPSTGLDFSPQRTIRNNSEHESNPLIAADEGDGLALSGVPIGRPGSLSKEQILGMRHGGEHPDEADEEDETHKQNSDADQTQDIPRVESPEPIKQVGETQSSKRPTLGPTRSEMPIRSRISSQNVPTSYSVDNLPSLTEKSVHRSSDDEDEDIPLGILAAHGFPNKNRPPARISMTGSHANLQSLSQLNAYPPPTGSVAAEPSVRNLYSPPAGSVVGEPSIRAGRTSTLPVFARGLPQDPYQATGLTHPSSRDPFSSGHHPAGFKGQGGIPPGGLVSVIAGEEKARALRRGSAMNNSGYGFGVPSNPGFGVPSNPGFGNFAPGPVLSSSSPRHSFGQIPNVNPAGMGAPLMSGGLPPQLPVSVTDQAQLQMSQQMTEMMRMQIQWMQQMMQLQGVQGMPNTPQPMLPNQPTLSVIPPHVHRSRPASVSGMSMSSNTGVVPPLLHQRSMSMLDPGMSFPNPQLPNTPQPFQYIPSFRLQAPNQPYAASIAPSERSNVGLPSRYRPVSTGSSSAVEKQDVGAPRASTFTSGTLKDWDARREGSSPAMVKPATAAEAKPAASGGKPPSDDDDDEEGWEEMKRKREKTKSKWKFKKEKESGAGSNKNKDMHSSASEK